MSYGRFMWYPHKPGLIKFNILLGTYGISENMPYSLKYFQESADMLRRIYNTNPNYDYNSYVFVLQ